MKRLLRWVVYVIILLVILGVAGFFAINPIAKSVAEKRIQAETGMKTQIGKFEVSFASRSVHLRDLRLINPPEFGGSTFIHVPELRLELDTEALEKNELHLKLVHLDLAELHVVQNKAGQRNIDILQPKGRTAATFPESAPTPATNSTNQAEQMEFGGIDKLKVSIGRLKWTDEKNPELNEDREVGMKDRVFEDIQNERDLQAVLLVIGLQAGISMSSKDSSPLPKGMFRKSPGAAKETEEILKGLVAPAKEKK